MKYHTIISCDVENYINSTIKHPLLFSNFFAQFSVNNYLWNQFYCFFITWNIFYHSHANKTSQQETLLSWKSFCSKQSGESKLKSKWCYRRVLGITCYILPCRYVSKFYITKIVASNGNMFHFKCVSLFPVISLKSKTCLKSTWVSLRISQVEIIYKYSRYIRKISWKISYLRIKKGCQILWNFRHI